MFSFAKPMVAPRTQSKGLGAVLLTLTLLLGSFPAAAQEPAAEATAPSTETSSTETSSTDIAAEETQSSEAAENRPHIDRSDGDPQWLEKQLTRNGELMPAVDVAAEDGFFQAKIAAEPTGPVQVMDESYLVTFRFTEEELSLGECYVFQDRLDMAASLMLFSDNIFAWVAQSYDTTIETKAVLAVDGGHVDGAPYLGLAWLFRMPVDGEPVAGQAKHWIAIKEERAIYCQTSHLGYDQTFFDLFAAFVESVEFQTPAARQPYFEEVAVLQINGQRLGVASTLHSVDGDGDLEYLETLSMLVPVDESTLQAQDTMGLSYSDLAGEVITEIHVEAENGEIMSNLRLDPSEDGTWSVSGLFQGKELQAELGAGEPRSDFGQRLDFVEFMKTAQPGATLAHQAWTPSMDPSRWDEAKVIYQGPHDDGLAVILQSGPMKLDAVTDENMIFKQVSMDLGGASMAIESVSERGDVWFPKTLQAAAETEDGAETVEDAVPSSTDEASGEASGETSALESRS